MTQSPETPAASDSNRRIIYFADPMCSWCWGFAPVIAAVRERCAGRVPIRLCLGGLRPYQTQPMTAQAKASVCHHWETVAEATGQPFDFRFFERELFVYDTEPACRAVVAMRALSPPQALAYFLALQQAFYAGNRDITQQGVLAELAGAFVASDIFVDAFDTAESRALTRADFELAKRIGISGFPTVLLQADTQLSALCIGWQPFEALEDPLVRWLEA